MQLREHPSRVTFERVTPEVDGGRFPIKRVLGEEVMVEADIFADGHDVLVVALGFRRAGQAKIVWTPMTPLGNDRWQGPFTVTELGQYAYTVAADVDHFETWRTGTIAKVRDGQDVAVDMLAGVELVRAASPRLGKRERDYVLKAARALVEDGTHEEILARLEDGRLVTLMSKAVDWEQASALGRWLPVVVDPPKAGFSSWYEMFPRSFGKDGRHGTFSDVEAQLPRIAGMGFDVLYFPPIHPVGTSFRKGANNTLKAKKSDPGSPWAIGSPEGGHKAVHPDLGTLDDFRDLAAKAKTHGIDIALDVAFQCSPDHPYVTEHPEWFKHRPDGTIQYAENPPKKYQDIYPFDFDTEAWQSLWTELKSIFDFWIEQGVTIFRVDNPHTKALPFWEWAIAEIKNDCPEAIFLAEAFTRPKVMYRLAKAGFTQSYTYYAWRNTTQELEEYLRELTETDVAEFFRPSFWPNTPDILTEYLQVGGRPAFEVRLILAATLTANYGIYGPAFELCEDKPREPGSEEYLNSEKYQLRQWDLKRRRNKLIEAIAKVNAVRRTNPALQNNRGLRFHGTDNQEIICYSKRQGNNTILVVANVDPQWKQSGWTELDLETLGLEASSPFEVHDLLTDTRYMWHGARNYVELDPKVRTAHVFRVISRLPTERNFDPLA